MRAFGILGLVIALAIGFYLYTRQTQTDAKALGAATPKAAIDTVGVKNDLLAFANAEKQQYALEGKYLSLDELRSKGTVIPANSRGPYSYTADVSDTTFRITATYSGPEGSGAPRTFSIGPTMQIE
ncbi:MAG: hypothetical protein ACR2IF_10895 [Terriglobales bacterium]